MTSDAIARRILVVDDDADVAQSFATLLQLLGHEACAITDSRAVLGTVARRRPDAVLLDINVPHVDGFKLTRMLKQAFPGICVVAITGQDSHQHRKQGRRNYAVLEGRPSRINLVIVLGSQGFTR